MLSKAVSSSCSAVYKENVDDFLLTQSARGHIQAFSTLHARATRGLMESGRKGFVALKTFSRNNLALQANTSFIYKGLMGSMRVSASVKA